MFGLLKYIFLHTILNLSAVIVAANYNKINLAIFILISIIFFKEVLKEISNIVKSF